MSHWPTAQHSHARHLEIRHQTPVFTTTTSGTRRNKAVERREGIPYTHTQKEEARIPISGKKTKSTAK